MVLEGTNECEVLTTVMNLNNKSSRDCNDISMSFVKGIISQVQHTLAFICNKSFSSGAFTDAMKVASKY